MKNLPTPLSNDEIVGYIYKTYDFGKFDTSDYNRKLSEGHIEKLKASFSDRDLGIASPVKTNEHGEVIDGGHTLEARKQGNFPLYHVIIEETSDEQDIARLKMNRKDWRNLTTELLADYESRSFEQMQEIEAKVKNLMPRESHPYPISLLIGEIKRLRKDEDLLFDAYTRMRKERDSLLEEKEMESKNYESD